MRKTTPKELIKLRTDASLTIKEAAYQSNTPYITWIKWENGTNGIPGIVPIWLKLCIKYNTIKDMFD